MLGLYVVTAAQLYLYRYRSGGGKSQNQLTVNELRQFVTQLYALPCVLSQTPLLKVMDAHVSGVGTPCGVNTWFTPLSRDRLG